MRTATAALAILTSGGLSLALADPPAMPVAPESQGVAATQSSQARDTAGQNNAAHTLSAPATAAAAQTAAGAKPAPHTPGERTAEQQLRREGYKPSQVNGETLYCKREAPLGSRIATTLHCMTVSEAEMIAREGRETTEHIQRTVSGCLGAAMGGCGK